MDEPLRNSLWTLLDIFFWSARRGGYLSYTPPKNIALPIWIHYFKKPIDTIPDHWDVVIFGLRKYFFECDWNEAYDFIEFMANLDEPDTDDFVSLCNQRLEQELAAYRFVGYRITEITSADEISEIEEALTAEPKALRGARTHLKAALDHLADRASPDYRNSIKESISAVEAVARAITGSPTTLAPALKMLKDKLGLHPALEGAFTKMYGYTSDADGIRHALMEESDLTFEDAKFMLVSCSAFMNYLIAKAAKAGIEL
jgi:hypothetical protein